MSITRERIEDIALQLDPTYGPINAAISAPELASLCELALFGLAVKEAGLVAALEERAAQGFCIFCDGWEISTLALARFKAVNEGVE